MCPTRFSGFRAIQRMPLDVLLLQIDRNPRLGCPAQVLELHLAQTKEGRDSRRGPPVTTEPSVRVDRLHLGAVARPLGVERAVFVDAAVRVRSEEVALTLNERRRQAVGAQAVVVRER